MSPPREVSPASLAVVRLAILAAVLFFGAAAWWVHRTPGRVPDPAPDVDVLRLAGLALWVLAASGVLVVRGRWLRATGPERARLSIVGWALGEIPALWGAAYYFLTGDALRYLTGVLFLALVFLLFPVPGRR